MNEALQVSFFFDFLLSTLDSFILVFRIEIDLQHVKKTKRKGAKGLKDLEQSMENSKGKFEKKLDKL